MNQKKEFKLEFCVSVCFVAYPIPFPNCSFKINALLCEKLILRNFKIMLKMPPGQIKYIIRYVCVCYVRDILLPNRHRRRRQ